ncbi:hypothetical protein [Zavarzinia sp. CC-PAN008]|uniref:hypothetical protein n=1 Tax=Zavarzinia sp. CC-PAN008 TaxID=3243332 RepID=UPI003F74224C
MTSVHASMATDPNGGRVRATGPRHAGRGLALAGLLALGAVAVLPGTAHAADRTVIVQNAGQADVVHLFASPVEATEWGLDRLGSKPVPAGGNAIVTIVNAGDTCEFDLKLVDANDKAQEFRGQNLCTTTVTLAFGGGGDGTPDFMLVNDAGEPVSALYVSPGTSSDWGDDVLGGNTVPASGRFDVDVPDPVAENCRYDVKAETSSGRSQEWRAVDLCATGALIFRGSNAATADVGDHPQDFALRNDSQKYVHYIYVSPTGQDAWGDDYLGDDVLAPAESFQVKVSTYPADACAFDVKVKDEDGNEAVFPDQNLCELDEIVFKGAEGANFGDNPQDFVVRNSSRRYIHYIYARPAGSGGDAWGDDYLGTGVLGPGETFNVDLKPASADQCRFDIRVVDEAGTEQTFPDTDLCAVEEVTFEGSGSQADATPWGKDPQDFTLHNGSDRELHYVYVSPPEAGDWQSDLLGSRTLAAGANLNINMVGFGPAQCVFDVRAVDDQGEEKVWKALNLCATPKLDYP